MDTRQLRHFAAVASTLHFGKAAEQLRMTQPPLSQSILALERELGAPLFARTKRRVVLTSFGAQWLAHVRPVLDGIEALPDSARRLREGRVGHLALSFVSTADYNILPSLVRRFTASFPEIELRLDEATTDVQIPALLERRAHAGIIIPPAAPLPSELNYIALLSEPLVAAVPVSWVSEQRIAVVDGCLPAQTVSELPLILFPQTVAPAFHDLVTGYFSAQGARADIVQQAIQMQTIISLVSAGLGIALVPASLRNMARVGVRYLDLEDAPILETGLIWRRADDAPTLHRFLEIIHELTDPERLEAMHAGSDEPM